MSAIDPTDTSAGTSEPVCPRHPDRVSYVRCQRCERPTCPQCQRPAAVGIQCVDCVRQAARTAPRTRTVLGGAGRPGGRPTVTLSVIGVCVAVWLAQFSGAFGDITTRFAFVPALAASEPYRFITSAFLHSPSSPLHILFNMYALYLIGPYLELELGRVRFAALYLLAAFAGSVFLLLLASPGSGSWYTAAVGASGAVFGLFGALLVVNRRLGRASGPIVAVIAINLVLGFLPGIAWQAHVGGLVAGVLGGAILAYAPAGRRTPVQVGGLSAIAVALLAATVLKLAAVG